MSYNLIKSCQDYLQLNIKDIMLEKITDTRFLLSCFSLIEFCKEIQTLVQEGYLIEESNQGLPQGYMGHYSCVMNKEVVQKEVMVREVQDTKTEPKKAGRPAKG